MIKFNNFDFQNFSKKYSKLSAIKLLEVMVKKIFLKKIAVTSSFGAESVVILHLISKVDKSIPVIFLDTGKLFPETIKYAKTVKKILKLNNIQIHKPELKDLKKYDFQGNLYKKKPNLCCHIRKVLPLQKALKNYDAWINGRKRFQSEDRSNIKKIEKIDGFIKINPLADWEFNKVKNYIKTYKLPEHPLVKKGYKSIGCLPCTSKILDGEPHRSGRWSDNLKTECGIHTYNPTI